MDYKTGRVNHIEDVLVDLHQGQWFNWSDSKNKIYANLILTEKMGVDGELIDNPYSLPTEKSLTDALAQVQSDFDTQEYARNRATAFPSIGDQLDMLFHDMTTDKGSKDGEWYKAVAKVKLDNPKPDGWKE